VTSSNSRPMQNAMDAASSASRAALRHKCLRRGQAWALDHNRQAICRSCPQSVQGTIGRIRKKWLCSNRCALFFSFCFRDQFAYFFLQHVPVLGTQYNYQVTIQGSRGGSKRRGQRNTAGKTPAIHPCATHTHASLAFLGNGFCGPFHQTIGWDGPV
jgi:hypothetical protein